MRPIITTLCVAMLTLCGAAAFAADVTGKWTGEMAGPDGSMSISYNFKQDGTKLTGTMDGPGGPVEIKGGKVDGNKISFTVSFDGGGGDMKITQEGTISGEEITLTVKMEGGPGGGPGGPGPIKLKRAK